MNKLRLHLEDLTVESFDTSKPAREKGTVFGEQQCSCGGTCVGQATCAYTCDDPTCPGCPTCHQTCEHTCDDSECIMTCIGDTCGGGGYTCWDSCGYTCYGTCPGWDC